VGKPTLFVLGEKDLKDWQGAYATYDNKWRKDFDKWLKEMGVDETRKETGVAQRVEREFSEGRVPYGSEEAWGSQFDEPFPVEVSDTPVWRADITDEVRASVYAKGLGTSQDAGNTIHIDQLAALAEKKGITLEQAISDARKAGWTVAGDGVDGDSDGPLPDPPPNVETETGKRRPSMSMNAVQIIDTISKMLHKVGPIIGRTKGKNFRRDKKSATLFMKTHGDLESFLDATGSRVHQWLFPSPENTFDAQLVSDELLELGADNSNVDVSLRERQLNGAAKFFRLWIGSKAAAKKEAPRYYKQFEAELAKTSDRTTRLRDAFQKMRELYGEVATLRDSDPDAWARAQIDSRGPSGPLITQSNFLMKFEVNWLNRLAPLKKVVRDMRQFETGSAEFRRSGTEPKRRGRISDILGTEDYPESILSDAFRMAESAQGSTIKARKFIQRGVADRANNPIAITDANGKVRKNAFHGGLRDAIEPVFKEAKKKGINRKEYLETFSVWLVHKHAPEVLATGKAVASITAESARQFVEDNRTEAFERAAQNIYDFQSSLLDYMIQEKALDQETANKLRETYQNYVPLKRVMDDAEVQLVLSHSDRMYAQRGYVLQRRRGSMRTVINPMESIIGNTFEIVQQTENANALRLLVQQAEAVGELDSSDETPLGSGQWIQRVSPKQVPVTVERDVKKILEELKEQGIEGLDEVNIDGLIHVFRPSVDLGKKEISIITDGKREVFRIPNEDLFNAVAVLGQGTPELFLTLFKRPAQLLRQSATTTIEFLIRNPVRDTWQASHASPHGFTLGKGTLQGLFHIFGGTRVGEKMFDRINAALPKQLHMNRGNMYSAFQNSGAGGHSLGSLDRDTFREELRRMGVTNPKGFAQFMRSVPHTAIEVMRGMQEALENASRVGEFIVAADKLQSEGVARDEAYARAAYSAAEVTVNFKRFGRQAKMMNDYRAFFNAALQGKLRLAEVFYRDPIGSAVKALTTVTTLSVATFIINLGDDEYDELPEWEKNAYWHIPMGRGSMARWEEIARNVEGFVTDEDVTFVRRGGHEWMRIPKPWELGAIFGNNFEAGLHFIEAVLRDGEATKAERDELWSQVLPDKSTAWSAIMTIIPTGIIPMVEAGANFSFFRNAPIVSQFDLGLSPELQAGRYTSDTARYLARATGLGAAKIDHLMQGYIAGHAKYVTDTVDQGLRGVGLGLTPPKPERGSLLTRTWGLRGLFRPSSAGGGARSLTDFYEFRERWRGMQRDVSEHELWGRYEEADKIRSSDEYQRSRSRDGSMKSTEKLIGKARDRLNALDRDWSGDPAARGKSQQQEWELIVNYARTFGGKSGIY
jgi:hypothetical protein